MAHLLLIKFLKNKTYCARFFLREAVMLILAMESYTCKKTNHKGSNYFQNLKKGF